VQPPATPPAARPVDVPPTPTRRTAAAAPAVEPEPFPKAPIVPFPVGTTSLAITSIVDLIVATGVPAILVGPDRSVKFVSEPVKALFEGAPGELATVQSIESKAGIRVGDLATPVSAGLKVSERNILYSLVPLSGGASGAVLVFRYRDTSLEASAPFTAYVRDAIVEPLQALRGVLIASAVQRETADPLLKDAASTLEQILSSLELAPGVSDRAPAAPQLPTVTDLVHRVAKRYEPYAELKGIRLQVDARELTETFHEHQRLTESLGILVDNALHFVPGGGQVVIGVRWMEHKGKPLLLFFVMDNGPLVPDDLRHQIFEPGFIWNPTSPERTGRGLFKVREFALAHSGSVWVESRTGKACTFFLRLRPDGVE
jgi:signal transduction histidine kinase